MSTDDLSWLRHRGRVPARTTITADGDDLSWIRHRRLPAGASATAPLPAPAVTSPAVPGGTSLDLSGASTSLDLSGGSGTPSAVPAGPPSPDRPGGDTSLDLSGSDTSLDLSPADPPPPSTSLDLSPAGPPPSTSLDLSPTGPPPSTSLDLSAGSGPPPGPPGGGGTSLDLFGEGARPPGPPGPPPPRPAPVATPLVATPPVATPPVATPPVATGLTPAAAGPAFTPPRTHPAAPTVLTPRQPSVQLTRLQSGIGALTFEAAWSPDEGFVLGCAYQMDSGWSSVLRPGETFGPLTMDRPAGHQRLRLDLLHGRHLQRLIVFGVPAVDPGPHWAGTLLISTHGHARIEVPVQPPPPGPTVLLSLYNVDGELVLRAEAQSVPGRIRDACLAFGYDRIAWRDADTAIPPAA